MHNDGDLTQLTRGDVKQYIHALEDKEHRM